MTATMRTNGDGQQRKTLASQLDRLDGILDGLDAALAGAVQEAVGLAVKEAVRTVLAEVLTNRDLQQRLRQATPDDAAEEAHDRESLPQRLWQPAVRGVRRAVQAVRTAGGRVRLGLLAGCGLAASAAYAARRRLASAAVAVYRGGKCLLGGALASLTRVLPSLAFGGI